MGHPSVRSQPFWDGTSRVLPVPELVRSCAASAAVPSWESIIDGSGGGSAQHMHDDAGRRQNRDMPDNGHRRQIPHCEQVACLPCPGPPGVPVEARLDPSNMRMDHSESPDRHRTESPWPDAIRELGRWPSHSVLSTMSATGQGVVPHIDAGRALITPPPARSVSFRNPPLLHHPERYRCAKHRGASPQDSRW
jgi:hypothetical protein